MELDWRDAAPTAGWKLEITTCRPARFARGVLQFADEASSRRTDSLWASYAKAMERCYIERVKVVSERNQEAPREFATEISTSQLKLRQITRFTRTELNEHLHSTVQGDPITRLSSGLLILRQH